MTFAKGLNEGISYERVCCNGHGGRRVEELGQGRVNGLYSGPHADLGSKVGTTEAKDVGVQGRKDESWVRQEFRWQEVMRRYTWVGLSEPGFFYAGGMNRRETAGVNVTKNAENIPL